MTEMTPEMMAALSGKFPANEVRKKGKFDYISHALITEHLNTVDPCWSFRVVREHTYIGPDGTMHCAGVTVEMTVGGVTRMEAGGPQRVELFANEVKNAVSDALKRAAMRFGVALYMWDKLVEAQYDEDATPTDPQERERRMAPVHREAERQGIAPHPDRPMPTPLPQRQVPQGGSSYPYARVAPRPCNSAVLSDYVQSFGRPGGNMGQVIRDLEAYAMANDIADRVVGSSTEQDERTGNPKVYPSDVYDYASHIFTQLQEGEATSGMANAMANDTAGDETWDDAAG